MIASYIGGKLQLLNQDYVCIKSTNKTIYIWGDFPKESTDDNIIDIIQNNEGDFFGLEMNAETITLFQSIHFPSRVYLKIKTDDWYLTDSASDLLQDINELEYNSFELQYFMLHGSSTAFSTYFKGVYKLIPGELIESPFHIIDDYKYRLNNNLFVKQLRKRMQREISFQEFNRSCNNVIEKYKNKSIGVLFSGGADSTFLLEKLREQLPDSKITALVFYSKEISSIPSWIDKKTAINYLEKNNIDYKIINPISKEALQESILTNIKTIPFDSHGSFWIGGALRNIVHEYDILITGQNADSIYNFGPTVRKDLSKIIKEKRLKGSGLGEELKRLLFEEKKCNKLKNNQNSFIYKMILKFLMRKQDGICLRYTKYTYQDFLKGFFSQTKYIAEYRSKEFYSYICDNSLFDEKLNQIVNSIIQLKLPPKADLVLEKLLSFILGSDSMVMYEIAKKIDQDISFPFVENEMLNMFCEYSFSKKDTKNPKRYIYEYLSNHGIKINKEINRNNFSRTKSALGGSFN
ncbi:MAG: hypothetical protein K6D95_03405 [Treponema sp.]|nr:hypothetical protein [Treponema sp.]